MDKLHEESRKQFEYEAGKALCLPISIIELARKGDGYEHAFDSMSIMQPLNGWWHWWQASRACIVVDIDWPEVNDNHWKDGEEGAYAQGYEVGKDLTTIKVRQAIRSIGLSIKGE
jgi:hypothetical protein